MTAFERVFPICMPGFLSITKDNIQRTIKRDTPARLRLALLPGESSEPGARVWVRGRPVVTGPGFPPQGLGCCGTQATPEPGA